MSNLRIYERVRNAPQEAQKKISGGRLNGMTDISPMWRIKMLTELFGPCGEGWMAPITKREFVTGADGQVAVFLDIELHYKMDGAWQRPIQGTGGSMFVSKERNGLYTDDEAVKKAYTDAIGGACKMLGMAADVYWDKDSKYAKREQVLPMADKPAAKINVVNVEERQKKLQAVAKEFKWGKTDANKQYIDACQSTGCATTMLLNLTDTQFDGVIAKMTESGKSRLESLKE